MSHDESGPVLRTSPERMMRGIIIVGVTLAISGGLLLFFFDEMIANPPPVALMPRPGPEPGPGPEPSAGTTTISILAGSSVQGAPDFDPDAAEVPLGNKVVFVNEDTTIHTATSGTGFSEQGYGEAFDTGFLDPGAQSDPLEIAGAAVGDAFDYFCQAHPFMLGTITIVEAEEGGAAGDTTGPAINILAGSSTQGAPDYDPDALEVAKGDTITVTNQDNTLHTITSGTDVAAADTGAAFNTDFMDPGATATIDTSSLDAGEYPYICLVHPFMAGTLTVTE